MSMSAAVNMATPRTAQASFRRRAPDIMLVTVKATVAGLNFGSRGDRALWLRGHVLRAIKVSLLVGQLQLACWLVQLACYSWPAAVSVGLLQLRGDEPLEGGGRGGRSSAQLGEDQAERGVHIAKPLVEVLSQVRDVLLGALLRLGDGRHPARGRGDALRLLARLGLLALLELLERERLQLREEAQVALLDHLRHVLLPPVVRRRVLLPQVDDQVEVAPHVVVVPDVLLEAAALSVERETVDAADEADVVHVVLLGEVLGAQLAKGVDDDTEDDVEEDGDDDHPERELVEDLEGEEAVVLGRQRLHVRADVAAAQSLVDGHHEAHEERGAYRHLVAGARHPLVGVVGQAPLTRLAAPARQLEEEGVCEEDVAKDRVDVDEEDGEEAGHQKGLAVLRDGLPDRLQVARLGGDVEHVEREEEGRVDDAGQRAAEGAAEEAELQVGDEEPAREHHVLESEEERLGGVREHLLVRLGRVTLPARAQPERPRTHELEDEYGDGR
mmetsp:Transcript_60645/g.180394  ORF Transcript_60645/g.180394 Transcript_60645/m.180394 type:complete len:499 (-) Transcript_60645:832-2328(-)